MIRLTRLNGKQFWLNAEMIETVEETPDVVVTLTNGHKYIVSESGTAVVSQIVLYRQSLQFDAAKGGPADEL